MLGETRGRRAPMVAVVAAGVTVLAVAGYLGLRTDDHVDGTDDRVVQVPASIPADCSRNVEADLVRFIASVRDGSIVQFPPSACYAQAGRIEVMKRRDLTFNGSGSTFRSSAPNTEAVQPNWIVVDSARVVFRDMVVEGNFTEAGPRSPATVGRMAPNQFNSGFSIYGGEGITVLDTTVRNSFGDGVTVAPSGVLPGGPGATVGIPRDVHLQRLKISHVARQGVAFTGGNGLWLEDSTVTDGWYWGVDAEIDVPGQSLKDVHVLRNTFDGVYFGAVTVPAPGRTGDVDTVEIRGNTLTSPADQCGPAILITYWPDTGSTVANVVIEDNRLEAKGGGIRYRDVASGSVRNNSVDVMSGCGDGAPVEAINSPAVVACGTVVLGTIAAGDPTTTACR